MIRTDPLPTSLAALRLMGRGVLPVLTLTSIVGLAYTLTDPVAVRESLFLALWAGAGVAAVTALAWPTTGHDRQLYWPAVTAVLVVTVVWVGHHQPYRGAAVSVILLLGSCLTLADVWRRRQRSISDDVTDDESEHPTAPLLDGDVAVPAAFAFQLALRPDLLLLPYFEVRGLVSLLLLPALAGIALAVLAERFDARRVALAGALALILGPGWNVTTTAALVALAAGSVASDLSRPAWLRWTALVSLLALPWQLGSLGVLFALAGISLVLTPTAGLLVLAAAGALALLVPAARGKPQAFLMFMAGLGMVPSALFATPEARWRMRQGGVIGLAAAMIGSGPEAMACGLALLALSVPVQGGMAELQRLWTATVLLGTCLFASYPWLRAEPRGALLRQLGIEPRGTDLIVPFVLVIGLGTLLQMTRQLAGRWAPKALWWALIPLAWVLLEGRQPVTVLRTSYEAVTLNSENFLLRQPFDPQGVRGVYIDSNLVHGLQLPPGTVVADVVLRDADNRQIFSWPLKAGVHTAEWAVARPDVASRPDIRAPHPWVSQISADGTFFSHRFRSRFRVAESLQAAQVHIRRRDDLPPQVQLVLYRLELRP